MKKMVIKISTPKDASLDKVRVYVSSSKESELIHKPENLVYEGVLVPEVKTTAYKDKMLNYIGVEYYNDAGKRYRSMRPTPVTMYSDLGPWEYASAPRFKSGDETTGVLSAAASGLLGEMLVKNYDFEKLFKSIASKVPSFFPLGTSYSSSPDTFLDGITVNGKLLLKPSNVKFSMTVADYHKYYRQMVKLPVADKQVVVGGFIWEADYFTIEDVLQFIPARLQKSALNSNTQANAVAANTYTDPFTGVNNAMSKTILEQDTPAVIQSVSIATNTVISSATGAAEFVTTNSTGSQSLVAPLVLRYVGQA